MNQFEPGCRAHINAPISVADVKGVACDCDKSTEHTALAEGHPRSHTHAPIGARMSSTYQRPNISCRCEGVACDCDKSTEHTGACGGSRGGCHPRSHTHAPIGARMSSIYRRPNVSRRGKGGCMRLQQRCGCNERGLCLALRIPPPASQTKVEG
jgi:hypothetical protein